MGKKRKNTGAIAARMFFGNRNVRSSGVSNVYQSKKYLLGVNKQAAKTLSTGRPQPVKRKVPAQITKCKLLQDNIIDCGDLRDAKVDKVDFKERRIDVGNRKHAYELRVRCNGKWIGVRQLIAAKLLSEGTWRWCAGLVSRELCQIGLYKMLEHFNLPISEHVRMAGVAAAQAVGVFPRVTKEKKMTRQTGAFAARMARAKTAKKKSVSKILCGDVSFNEFVKNVPKSNGHKYEAALSRFLHAVGLNARRLSKVADHGADIIVRDAKHKVAIQCKFYGEARVGNAAVQQAFSGMHFYDCDAGWVVTNSRYTASASVEAKKLGVRMLNHDSFPQVLANYFGLLTPTGRMKKRKKNS